jgi:hypothetical protein
MKNIKNNLEDENYIIPPFDFESSISNKYAKFYEEDDKTIIIKSHKAKTIVLDSDIANHFPDSKSVNYALRSLIKAFSVINNQQSYKIEN